MSEPALAAEQKARVLIDRQLTDAGWVVQDKKALNLFAGPGVAVREVVMKPGHGRVDYLLYVDKTVVGVIEAKPLGNTLSGVEWQSAMYADGLPADVRLAALTTDVRLRNPGGVGVDRATGLPTDVFTVIRGETAQL